MHRSLPISSRSSLGFSLSTWPGRFREEFLISILRIFFHDHADRQHGQLRSITAIDESAFRSPAQTGLANGPYLKALKILRDVLGWPEVYTSVINNLSQCSVIC